MEQIKKFLHGKGFALVLAACLLGLVLAGCSATGRVGPNGMYGNVSTTTDGRVNGTNDYYNGYSGRDGQTYNDTNGRTYSGTNDRTYNDGTNGQTYHSTNGQTYSGTTGHIGTSGSTATQRGTGMAGGR
mgnify:CR=1 FL=1